MPPIHPVKVAAKSIITVLYWIFSYTTSTLSAELTAMDTSAQRFAYYKAEPMPNVSVGIRQMLLKNKLSVSLNANDLFYTFKTDMTAKNEGMDYHVKVNRDSRWVGVSLRYMFGSDKVTGARDRATGIENEKQRITK